jgi:uncharacterized protein YwqG
MPSLRTLFGLSRRKPPDELGIEEHLEYLNALRRPALALSPSAEPSTSRIGGLPSLPEDVPWPQWKGVPLAFLCQVDLSRIPAGFDRSGLPSAGMLYFFYDQAQSTWGFDPQDEGSWQVVYSATATGGGAARAAPEGLDKQCVYHQKAAVFAPVATYPSLQDERVDALKLTDRQVDEYIELCSSVFQSNPAHHLLGYPSPIQGNDMDLECQLVSHGLYCGDLSGYQDPRAKELEAGRGDWILLLQLDSDDAAGMMWGDGGMLYFWIKRNDLKEARFDRCWMILQCG